MQIIFHIDWLSVTRLCIKPNCFRIHNPNILKAKNKKYIFYYLFIILLLLFGFFLNTFYAQ